MTRCLACHRPMKHPTDSGLGPTCAKKAKVRPQQRHERDLLGFNIELACSDALELLRVHIEGAALEAHFAVRAGFAAARRRLGVWS